MKVQACWTRDSEKPDVGRIRYRQAIERYWFMWTVVLVLVYGFVYWVVSSWGGLDPKCQTVCTLLIFIGGFFTFWRCGEIASVVIVLHFVRRRYRTSNPAHALTLTVVAYIQVLIAFGTFYLIVSLKCSDRFAGKCDPAIYNHWLTPIYFSTSTITTLGFGDYSSTLWPGQMLVIAEVLMGLALIVVAFQRTIGASMEDSAR